MDEFRSSGPEPLPPAHAASSGFAIRYLLSGIAIAVLALATILGALQIGGSGSPSIGSLLTFLVILSILWGALLLEIPRRPFSLHLMHLIAMYIFLAVAPLYQVIYGLFPLELFARVDSRYVLRANLLVTLWLLFYLAFYSVGRRLTLLRLARRGETRLARVVSPWRINAALLVSFGVMGYLAALGLAGITTRAGAFEAVATAGSSPLMLINNVFVRAFPVVALGAGGLLLARSFRATALFTGPLVLLASLGNLYVNNPLASARYWTISVLLGFIAPHVLQRRATAVLMLVGVICGFAVLPGLGNARDANSFAEMLAYVREVPSPALYLARSGDVGSYGIFILVLRYIDRDGLRLGQQLAGVLLFWVPRSVWHAKPIGTGAFVASHFGFDFTNLSAPIVAEAVVDFGCIGVALLAALFGLVLSRLDTVFWRRSDGGASAVRSIDTVYPFLLGLVVFMTRGDLLSSFGYTLGFVASAIPPFFLGGRSVSRSAPFLERPNGRRGRTEDALG